MAIRSILYQCVRDPCWGRRGATSFDVGTYEKAEIHLIEVDPQGRRRWTEAYAVEKLGDAIARLYERCAELLPEGPERSRAAATARTVAVLISAESLSADRYATTYAPGAEFVDYRALIGLPPARGADEIRQRLQRWFETVADSAHSFDDVIDLRPDGLLVRQCERGRDRVGGGSFEGQRLILWIFDADGLQTRTEMFDPDRAAEALARFDELTADGLEARHKRG